MSASSVVVIPSHRRDQLFAEIRQVVLDYEAANRSLAGVGEELDSDAPLEAIVELIEAETEPTHRTNVAAA
jgi:hypothetical protein